MANDGLLLVLSGPSGAGKGTLVRYLLSIDPTFRLSVSATTRGPREGEIDGKDYYFRSRESFQELVSSGRMLESAEYCGNFYGTPAAPIEEWTSRGLNVILEIEVQGGAQIKEKRPDCVGVFLLPPSMRELERRLRKRGTENEETIQKRLGQARRELREAEHYDYAVVNDTSEQAAERIRRIVEIEKYRTHRNVQLIERMLNE